MSDERKKRFDQEMADAEAIVNDIITREHTAVADQLSHGLIGIIDAVRACPFAVMVMVAVMDKSMHEYLVDRLQLSPSQAGAVLIALRRRVASMITTGEMRSSERIVQPPTSQSLH